MINTYKGEWTDSGAEILVYGFLGKVLLCPRCQVELPRAKKHRCGDRVLKVKNKVSLISQDVGK
jgi:hypothetical protein